MKTRRTRVYVAGPITIGDRASNIRNALDVTNELMDHGYAPYTPHLTHFQQLMFPREYEDWMSLDFEWLPLCDVLLRLPGISKGADREVKLAKELGIPVHRWTGQIVGTIPSRIPLAPVHSCPPFFPLRMIDFYRNERKPNPDLSGRRDPDQYYIGRRKDSSEGGRRVGSPRYAGRRDLKYTDPEMMSGPFRGGRRVNDLGRAARITTKG